MNSELGGDIRGQVRKIRETNNPPEIGINSLTHKKVYFIPNYIKILKKLNWNPNRFLKVRLREFL